MNSIQQQLAFLSVAAFFGTVFVLGLCGLAVVVSLIGGSRRIAAIAAGGVLAIVLAYASVLVGFSLVSREAVLPLGAEKYFCEIDCHIANAVTQARLISPPEPELAAPLQNQLILVQVRTWFDPATISPHRGNSPLMPNPRTIFLQDSSGRRFEPFPRQSQVLALLHLDSTPMRTPLRPGESYFSYFVFETPAGTQGLRLGIQASTPEESLLWGNELSPLHKKTYFDLFATPEQSRN
jgi:hypothetical protein